jgi:hypothetical protein
VDSLWRLLPKSLSSAAERRAEPGRGGLGVSGRPASFGQHEGVAASTVGLSVPIVLVIAVTRGMDVGVAGIAAGGALGGVVYGIITGFVLVWLSQPKEGDGTAVSRMTRQELIESLRESNEHFSFQFNEDWLSRQWTPRLRTLLVDQRQHPGKAPNPI